MVFEDMSFSKFEYRIDTIRCLVFGNHGLIKLIG